MTNDRAGGRSGRSGRAGSPGRLRRMRERRAPDLLSGFWFLAVVVSLVGPALAVVTIVIDKSAGDAGLFGHLIVSPDSARTIFGSIAGSLITIASLTSSLTIVTLQLLSNQYTPRTVRGFLSTRLSQVVLGSFVGIFLYCLLLLVSVREPGDENQPFVPSLGVVVSVVLAVVGLILLILFIHAMSQTIQVSTMAARIGGDTATAVSRVHGEVTFVVGTAAEHVPDPGPGGTTPVTCRRTGYVRGVDLEYFTELLSGVQVTVLVPVRPGDFVTMHTVVALVHGRDPSTIERVRNAIDGALVVARERELRVDPGYGLRQLVDIALRALSPGINDPSTAITCMGYLRDVLENLAGRELAPYRTLRDGSVFVCARAHTFEDYLEPLAEISGYAAGDARVVWTLLDALDGIAGCAVDAHRKAAVCELREEIRAAALAEPTLPRDRARLHPES